jgi:hypothetical protein
MSETVDTSASIATLGGLETCLGVLRFDDGAPPAATAEVS